MIFAAGFAEVGDQAMQDAVTTIARSAGLAVVGPNCLGITNNVDRMWLHMLYAREAKQGVENGIAIVGQSGCGKSTIATSLAAYFASEGYATALADFDPQGSALSWLEQRPADCAPIKAVRGFETGLKTVPHNAEYVVIKNTTRSNRVLTGWTLRDKTGYTYRFPSFTLKAGASVTVHTGRGSATSAHRYYNKSWYVWNNTGDTAYLKNASGTTVDTCTWKGAGTAKYC